jgi:hypothetical protein
VLAEPPESHLQGYDPQLLASDIRETVQNIKKKTVADVLHFLEERKGQTKTAATQVQPSDLFLVEQPSVFSNSSGVPPKLTKQPRLQSEVTELQAKIQQAEHESSKQLQAHTILLCAQARKLDSLEGFIQDTKKQAENVLIYPQISLEHVQSLVAGIR